ncbi:MAG: hypothetical protein ACLQUY_21000 [Ktedonobacterales bacterium]
MNPEQPLLTTDELLAECEKATDIRFTVNRLGDWVHEGLLPVSKPGRGRGRGVGGSESRRWELECLPRLLVIAGCCTGKNLSIPKAAYALASEGYVIDPKLLRGALESCLQELQSSIMDPIKWRRPFLDPRKRLPPEEQRQRLHRSEQKKYKHVDPAVGQLVEQVQLTLLGLTATTDDTALEQLLALFSYDRLSSSVKDASDNDIRQAFLDAGNVVPQLVPKGLPLLSLVYTAGLADGMAKDPPEWANLQQTLRELAHLFSGEDPAALARKVRIPITLVALHVQVQGITNLSELAGTAFKDIMTYILWHTGEVGDSIRTALEQALGKVDEQAQSSTVDAVEP